MPWHSMMSTPVPQFAADRPQERVYAPMFNRTFGCGFAIGGVRAICDFYSTFKVYTCFTICASVPTKLGIVAATFIDFAVRVAIAGVVAFTPTQHRMVLCHSHAVLGRDIWSFDIS